MRLIVLIAAMHAFGAVPEACLAFREAAVFDGTQFRANQTVIVTAGTISEVGAAVRVPRGCREINARGKFLIPGLWDMHVHLTTEPWIPQYHIANGVTGVRDMFGDLKLLPPLRARIARGGLPGPEIIYSGPLIDGPRPEWPGSTVVRTPDDARRAARDQKAAGAQFLKVYNGVSRDAYYALMDEAKRLDLAVAGHPPDVIGAAAASDAGQKSIEHLTGVFQDAAAPSRIFDLLSWYGPFRRAALVREPDPARLKDVFERFRRNGTWHCPTITVYRGQARSADAEFRRDPRFRYFPRSWVPKPERLTPEEARFRQKLLANAQSLTRGLYRAGVPLLAGTDAGNPFCLPGFSLHDELELLVSSGIPANDVLRIATENPARYFGLRAGRIAPGNRADLVLLRADPLASISNTRSIEAVVAAGRFFDWPAIHAMREEGARAAAAADRAPKR